MRTTKPRKELPQPYISRSNRANIEKSNTSKTRYMIGVLGCQRLSLGFLIVGFGFLELLAFRASPPRRLAKRVLDN